jgi:hypothetical protein
LIEVVDRERELLETVTDLLYGWSTNLWGIYDGTTYKVDHPKAAETARVLHEVRDYLNA